MKFKISPKKYETELNWDDAIIYCSMLDINGYGWRLPTADELCKIYNSKNNFKKDFYWTGTEGRVSILAWSQNFNSGHQCSINKTNHYYVRAIRDL